MTQIQIATAADLAALEARVTAIDGGVLGSVSPPTYETDIRPPAAMARWKSARVTGNANVVFLGDSITAGGVGAGGDSDYTYARRAMAMLREQYQPVGVSSGEGFLSLETGTGGRNAWSFTGTTYPAGINEPLNYGFGLYGRKMTTGGDAMTLVTKAGTTSVTIYGRFVAGVNGGTATVTINGSPPGAQGAGTLSSVNTNTSDFPDYSLGTYVFTNPAIANTITLTRASGSVTITGAMVYGGDEEEGLRGIFGGHGGTQAYGMWGSTQEPTFWQWLFTTMDPVPALFFIFLGVNDRSANYTPAQYRGGMERIVARVRSACTILPTIVIGNPWERDDPATYTWDQYETELVDMINDDGDLCMLDIRARTGDVAAPLLPDLFFDDVHPSALGAGKVAAAIYDFVGPSA